MNLLIAFYLGGVVNEAVGQLAQGIGFYPFAVFGWPVGAGIVLYEAIRARFGGSR